MPRRILIVDDNALVRRLVRTHLESEPRFAVCQDVATGFEAIERVMEHKPDLVILDLSMPQMNGLQVATALKMLQYHIPIVLFSAFVEVVPEHSWRSLGIRSAVSKSAPIEVLLKEVQRLVPTSRSASA
jgi:CheY-like chemotaxis protein